MPLIARRAGIRNTRKNLKILGIAKFRLSALLGIDI